VSTGIIFGWAAGSDRDSIQSRNPLLEKAIVGQILVPTDIAPKSRLLVTWTKNALHADLADESVRHHVMSLLAFIQLKRPRTILIGGTVVK
jgi:hypothetical protein